MEVKASGINPVDTYIRTGTYAIKPNLPYTPGSDVAGSVKSVGAGVAKFKVGIIPILINYFSICRSADVSGSTCLWNKSGGYIRTDTHSIKPNLPYSNFILLIVPRRYFCCGSNCFVLWSRFLCCLSLMYVFIF